MQYTYRKVYKRQMPILTSNFTEHPDNYHIGQ